MRDMIGKKMHQLKFPKPRMTSNENRRDIRKPNHNQQMQTKISGLPILTLGK